MFQASCPQAPCPQTWKMRAKKPSAKPPAVGLIISRNLVNINQPSNHLHQPTANRLCNPNPKGARQSQAIHHNHPILSILCIDVKAKST